MAVAFDMNSEQDRVIIDTNNAEAQRALNAAEVGVLAQSNQFVYFAAFDGTNNDTNTQPQTTNVRQLYEQYENNIGLTYEGNYFPGPGTEGTLAGSSWISPQVTAQVIQTAKDAYEDFAKKAAIWLETNPNGSVTTALTAFSRGCASAAIFTQMIYEKGLVTSDGKVLIPPGEVDVSAAVLYDPVTTGVNCNLALAPNVKNAVVVIAKNEYRHLFMAADYSNHIGVTTVEMYGNHCDVGGSYASDEDGLSALTLEAATDYFAKSGLPINPVPENRRFNIEDIRIHDESRTWDPSLYGYRDVWQHYGELNGIPSSGRRLYIAPFENITPDGWFTLYDGTKVQITGLDANSERVEHDKRLSAGTRVQVLRYYHGVEDDLSPADLGGKVTIQTAANNNSKNINAEFFAKDESVSFDVETPANGGTTTVKVGGVGKFKMSMGGSNGQGSIDLSEMNNDAHVNLAGDVASPQTGNVFTVGMSSSDAISNVRGGAGNDSLTGNSAANILDGGAGNDRIRGGKGDDILQGGTGSNEYRYIAGDGKDTVIDSGEAGGKILIGDDEAGFEIKGVKAPKQGSGNNFSTWEDKTNGLTYTLRGGTVEDGMGELVITGEKLGGGDSNSITIKNFKNGKLGITLENKQEIEILPGRAENQFRDDPEHQVATGLVTDLKEGAAKTFTVALASASSQAQTITVKLGNLADKFYAILGDDVIPFAGGEITLTVPAGQNTVSFGLWAKDDVDSSAAIDMTASWQNLDGSTTVSHGLTLNFEATNELDQQQIQTTRTITGDLQPIDFGADPGIQTQADELGNVIVGAGAEPDRRDRLYDSAENDLIRAGGGDDYVDAIRGGDDVIEAGAGDDEVNAGDGNDHFRGEAGQDVLRGEGGDDVIEGNEDADIAYGHDGKDTLYGEAKIALADAIQQGATGDSGVGQGEFLQGGAGDDTIIGSNRADMLGGGDGDDVLVSGQGDDLILGDSTYSAFDKNWGVTVEPESGNTIRWTINGASETQSNGSGADVIFAGAGNDFILAEGGDDFITAEAGNDIAWGDSGNDTVLGGDGDDVLSGDNAISILTEAEHGDDFIDGGSGNDRIYGNGGSDTLFGGDGNDTISGDASDVTTAGHDYIDGENGNDYLVGGSGRDQVYGGAGDDILSGDSNDTPVELHDADELYGEEGKDRLQGYGGDDYLDGGSEDDILFGDLEPASLDSQYHGKDILNGGDGADYLEGGGQDDTLLGGEGADSLWGDASTAGLEESANGQDYLDGGNHDDALVGGGNDDILIGGEGNDLLWGDAEVDKVAGSAHGADMLDGGVGDDILYGDGGDDVLMGGDGDDQLDGDSSELSAEFHGNDILDGGAGNDQVYGSRGEDVLYGGEGNDILVGDLGGDDVSVGDADVLDGGAGDDQLFGYGGDDVLSGGDGIDTLTGHDGNDYLDGGNDDDTLYGGDGDDVLEGGAGNDLLVGGNGNDTMMGGDGDDLYYFELGSGAKHIVDSSGHNRLIFRSGISFNMLSLGLGSLKINIGTGGDEIHIDDVDYDDITGSSGIHSVEFADGQTMTITELVDALGINIGGTELSDTLDGTSADDHMLALDGDDFVTAKSGHDHIDLAGGDDMADAGEGNDTVTAGSGNDTVWAGYGNDVVHGDAGDDTLFGDDGSDTLHGGAQNDSIDGGAGDDRLFGDDGVDSLLGGAGNDALDGGAGDDALAGGAGDDCYVVDSSNDLITENADEGTDIVVSSASYTLSAHIENLTLSGENAIDGTGNSIDNVIIGNVAANVLTGAEGDDRMEGDAGADTLLGGAGNDALNGGADGDLIDGGSDNDRLDGGSGADTLLGADGSDTLNGGSDNDSLDGGAGNDVLDGGTGADIMAGGAGDDQFFVDQTDDVLIENADDGYDAVIATADFSLSAHLEDLILAQGSLAREGSGNAQDNWIEGNEADNTLRGMEGNDYLFGGAGNDVLEGGAGNDELEGGLGADTMAGGDGDDIYYVEATDDVIVENAGEGTDTVYAAATYVLSADIENLTLDSSGGHIDGTGNAQNNHLIGNEYNNRLDGGAGTDVLEGGAGDDTYVVDSSEDRILEDVDSGNDTVESSIDYTLGATLENIVLTGDSHLNATGNDGENRLAGNNGNNRLDGGLGSDTMAGGSGDDTYYTDRADDRVIEFFDNGIDTEVRSFETAYLLDDGVENLVLTGTVYRGNGNELDNVITGNDSDNNLWGMEGNDTLVGGGGSDALFGDVGQDTLIGGTGDDYYEIDDAGDAIVENANEGDDFVRSTVSWTLGDNLERLAVDGDADLSVTGNTLNNGLWGNGGNNTLTGGRGNDYLVGYDGDDNYVFNRGDGQDTIDNADIATAIDTLQFGAGVTDADVLGFRSGNNLFLKIKGTNDQVGFANWYAADSVNDDGEVVDHKIDYVQFQNGVAWDQATIQQIVDRATSNHAPVVNHGLPTLAATQDKGFTYVVPGDTITDPDAWDSVMYSAKMADGSPLPSWLQFDSATRTFSGTPGAADVGSLQFVLWGTDNYGYAAGVYVNMTVGLPNRAPTLVNPLADQTLNEGATLAYSVPASAFTDPDAGDKLTYTATLADGSALPSWLTFNPTTRTFSGTAGAAAIGRTSVKVTATDTGSLAISDVFDIVVNVQNLTLNGTAYANTLTGRSGNDTLNGQGGNDTLVGNAGNDRLDGGAGNDRMTGGTGDDTYVVNSLSDVVIENANEGIDAVQSSITYTLGANVENLTLTGTTAINGTGNALNNVLVGNNAINMLTGGTGNDLLNGGVGADKLNGGTGNDTYVVDNAGDVVTENANEGIDSVLSSVTYTLTTNVEALTLTGTTAVNGTGNAANNLLIGNGANNTLNGAAGTDLLQGAAGTDTISDTSGNNLFDGGAGNDTLTGGVGNEFFAGGGGNDTITTSTGADVIAFNRGDGQDLVNASTGKDNTLSLGRGITYADLSFKKSANDLILVTGAAEQITLKDWYASTNNRSVSTLQIVIEGTTDYDPSSASQMNNKKVEQFNFDGLAGKFDQALAATPSLTNWTLSSSLLEFHLGSSDTAAIGGDLAYQYAKNGSLSSLSMTPAQALLASPQFGTANQSLQAATALEDGSPRLM